MGGFISAVQVQPRPSRSAGSDWSGRALRRTDPHCAAVRLDAGLIFELANPATVLPGTIGLEKHRPGPGGSKRDAVAGKPKAATTRQIKTNYSGLPTLHEVLARLPTHQNNGPKT